MRVTGKAEAHLDLDATHMTVSDCEQCGVHTSPVRTLRNTFNATRLAHRLKRTEFLLSLEALSSWTYKQIFRPKENTDAAAVVADDGADEGAAADDGTGLLRRGTDDTEAAWDAVEGNESFIVLRCLCRWREELDDGGGTVSVDSTKSKSHMGGAPPVLAVKVDTKGAGAGSAEGWTKRSNSHIGA